MWCNEEPDDRAGWIAKHFYDFAHDPLNFWALSTGLDASGKRQLKGRPSTPACADLFEAIERAQCASDEFASIDISQLTYDHGFAALYTLVRAWEAGALEHAPMDPRLRDSFRYARILQNCAHNASLLQEIARSGASGGAPWPVPSIYRQLVRHGC